MSQKLASGFNRNHMLNGEGGTIAEESRNTYVIDRVNTTSTVWLGLTLGCCQCHDHKYDPFTQKEYYQLFAYFNNLPESGGVDAGGNAKPVMKISTPEQDKELAALKEKQSQAAAALAAAFPKIDAAQAEWERTIDAATGPAWTMVVPGSVTSKNGATMTTLEDGSVLVSGKNPDTDVHDVTFKTPLENIGGLKLEALPDDSLPHGGPGRSEDTGNFVPDRNRRASRLHRRSGENTEDHLQRRRGDLLANRLFSGERDCQGLDHRLGRHGRAGQEEYFRDVYAGRFDSIQGRIDHSPQFPLRSEEE